MGKKEKLNVKNVKEKTKPNEEKKKSSGLWWKLILLSGAVKAVLVGIFIYSLFKVPDLPEVDLKQNWGDKENTDVSIRPYRVVFTEAMQDKMRNYFEMHRRNNVKPSFEMAAWTYGTNAKEFPDFIAYWVFDYHFKDRAKFLNQFDHFKTYIQGLDIHFIRVKPKLTPKQKNIKVLPLLLLHGWPGSVREFYEAIPKLIVPRRGHDFVFEVIAPSLPGFIYSEGPTKPGMSAIHVAVIMRNLMRRLGHTKFYVQGGGYGHLIGSHMATIFPEEVQGFHTNSPVNFSKLSILTWLLGSLYPAAVEDKFADRMYPLTEKLKYYLEESGFYHLQSTKPDTIGLVLQDSPVGMAAYILDRFMILTDPENKNRTHGGLEEFYSSEKLLDNIMLYYASDSIVTALRHYKEALNSEEDSILAEIPTRVPTWALRFRHEPFYQPEFMIKWKYPNLIGATTSDVGGHFAAFERPKSFADDLFRAVDTFIKFRAMGGK